MKEPDAVWDRYNRLVEKGLLKPGDHMTDGNECWCNPEIIKEGESTIVVHHDRSERH